MNASAAECPEESRAEVRGAGSRSDSSSCSESEEEQNLNDFQRKMKLEHRQALAKINKACVMMERNRRKRITVSCGKLRELLPRLQGVRSDMVTVLEMTIAFLEHVKVFAEGHQYREILYPPQELYCMWLLETQLRKQECQRKVSEEEQRQNVQRCPRRQGVQKCLGDGTRRKPSSNCITSSDQQESSAVEKRANPPQHLTLPDIQQTNSPVASSVLETQEKFCAPSFWSPVNLISPLSSVSRIHCPTPMNESIHCENGIERISPYTSGAHLL
ncbi:uncharacterized protein LOC108938518 [Scleropages formosus]|uniref:uncharacterized protein LOC108938518 n=1 Tax=Scleropages formosus TaxID=113540 RepID=UPI000879149F|nr:spermatogenesis- and oogenesis-specific basic helix-loop-helix-containing protein 1 [Scleropages formosus]